jgi:hypothetical protein
VRLGRHGGGGYRAGRRGRVRSHGPPGEETRPGGR